tara:strand:- start:4754 stop:5509 length:756 start_codon:yes stop_codon:yes gene_type:complete
MAVILSSGVSIKEQIALLVELQEVDMAISGLHEQKTHLPKIPDSIRQLLQQAKQGMIEAANLQEEVQSSWKSLESDLEEQEKSIQKSKGRLSELKTNKEYQAHLFEIDLAGKKRSQVEERLLLIMDRAEAVDQQVLKAKEEIGRQEAALEASLIKIEVDEADIDLDLEVLLHSQKQLIPQLDEALLKQYEQVRSSHSGRPMVSVHGGACSGCQLQVPPQLVAEVRRGEALHVCSHCQRFLFWPREQEPDAK